MFTQQTTPNYIFIFGIYFSIFKTFGKLWLSIERLNADSDSEKLLNMVKAVCVLGPGGKPCSVEETTTVCSGTVEFEQETEESPTKVGSELDIRCCLRTSRLRTDWYW